eukprot:m.9989 g.9989  ORF g.9989 m.9989 type:complete len:347 (+) comp5517_c0_seq2:36-1076(+)
MEDDFEIWVDYPQQINYDMYLQWLKGDSEADAAKRQPEYHRFQVHSLQEAMDQYHLFAFLEKSLQNPPSLFHSANNSLPQASREWIVNRYYEFDETFLRQLLGRNLSSRTRNKLDDISRRLGLSQKSCRRQFDNARRVFKAVEDEEGALEARIGQLFMIRPDLAQQYARVAFLLNNRFHMGGRKLASLTLADLLCAAEHLSAHWTGAPGSPASPEIDRAFLIDLGALKSSLTGDAIEAQRGRVRGATTGTQQARLEAVVRPVIKALVGIAAGLHKTKHLQNLFVDVFDKVVQPCRERGLGREDMLALLDALQACAHEGGPLSAPCYQRFLRGLAPVLLHWCRPVPS